MKLNFWALSPILLVISLSFLTACSKDEGDKQEKKINDRTATYGSIFAYNSRSLQVVSISGKPVPKAQILIGSAKGSPFKNNLLQSDQNGFFTAPEEWAQPLTVTIVAPGFIRASYLYQVPNGQVLTVRPQEKPKTLELTGKTSGFQIVNKDDKVDFAFSIPVLSKKDLFNFNIDMVLSPEIDEITVLGRVIQLPSNVTLPQQKESYIFPITLDKQNFRMYFAESGNKQIFTARGQFPLKKVVDKMKNGSPFYELLDDLSIQGGSLKKIDVSGKNSVDLPVNELTFTERRNFTAPAISDEQFLMSLALSDYQERLFPTDVKRIESNALSELTTAAGSTPHLVTILKNKSESTPGPGIDRVSATIIPFKNGAQPRLLPLLPDPEIIAFHRIRLAKIQNLQGLEKMATYAILSEISEKFENKVWEVYAEGWQEEINLPNWPLTNQEKASKSKWETSFISGPIGGSKSSGLGPKIFENATHATHSSSQF